MCSSQATLHKGSDDNISHVGVFFVSCYMASRRGVARTVVGGCLEPTYIPILLTYPNRLRKDCRDGSGNQYPS